jgi:hypothetical protein
MSTRLSIPKPSELWQRQRALNATSINRDEDDQPSKGGVLQELRSIAPIGVSWPQLQGKSTRPGNKQ